MKSRYAMLIRCLTLGLLLGLPPITARAVDDGRGTNIVNLLRVTTLQIGSETRTNWPASSGSLGGMVEEVSAHLNMPIWDSAITWKGQLQKAQMQVNEGTADVHVVRAAWNDAWGACTTINTLRVTAAGVADSTWTSAWASNDYRIGIVVTNSESAARLWWSVTYTKE